MPLLLAMAELAGQIISPIRETEAIQRLHDLRFVVVAARGQCCDKRLERLLRRRAQKAGEARQIFRCQRPEIGRVVRDPHEQAARRLFRELGRERARGVEQRGEPSLRSSGRREAGRVSQALSQRRGHSG